MNRDIIGSLHQVITYLSHAFLGGPRWLKFNWVINFQKGSTLIWVLGLMALFSDWSIQAWVYLALHGSYGLIWIFKDLIFPDGKWQARITLGGAFMAMLAVLGPYWIAPLLLIHPGAEVTGASPPWLGVAILVYAIGLTLMLVADAQKYYTLKIHPGLITSGLFRYIRHPNYLGEMMIYGSFALVVWHWLPWAILAWVWLGYFSINIAMKERSMSRYPHWRDYKRRSWYLIPYIF